MSRYSLSRYSFAVVAAVFGLLLTSCTSSTHRARSPMTGGTAVRSTSSSMMGGGADYHYSRLSCAAPDSLPGHTVNVTLADVGMTQRMGGTAPMSARGATAGRRVPGTDGKVDEAGSLGESSNTCTAGTGDGITPGGFGWTTVTLKPGHYELLCNLPNHYADGMHQELIVT